MLESRRTAASVPMVIPDIIPIFPLPNVVFFPDTYLPLHIFEPRYRDMIADIGTENACIGMVLQKDEEARDASGIYLCSRVLMALSKDTAAREDDGPIAICSPGCVGRIHTITPLRDGRANLVLHGLTRYVIEEYVCGTRYRRARVTVPPHRPFQTMDETVRERMTALAVRYLRARRAKHLCALATNASLPDAVLVNSLSSCLDFTTVEKQFLLESDSLDRQARRLTDLLTFKLSDTRPAPGGGR